MVVAETGGAAGERPAAASPLRGGAVPRGMPKASRKLVNRRPSRPVAAALAALPFAALVAIYAWASHVRRLENPADKLLPSLDAMAAAFWRLATEPDRRTGDLILWVDTFDSLARLGAGIGITALLALGVGVAMGFLPHARAMLSPFVSAVSLVPPITVLPILFIAVGLGEASKIALIVVGTAPIAIRAVAQGVLEIPRELIVKAETLGASTLQIATRVVLPWVWPRLVTAIRYALVPGWIFLVSAEAIASTSGLGYRILLVRRFLAMDVILPYVAWITLLAFLLDRALLLLSRRLFRWHHLAGESL